MTFQYEKLKAVFHDLHSVNNAQTFRQDVLMIFQQHFQLEHAIFWLCNDQGHIQDPIMIAEDGMNLEKYQQEYMNNDFLLPKHVKHLLRQQNVLTLEDVITPARYERSMFYNDFMKKHGFYEEMGIYLKCDGAFIGGISFAAEKYHPSFKAEVPKYLDVVAYDIAAKCKQLLTRPKMTALTETEFEVCSFIEKGLSNKEIAAELFVSDNTVKKHIQNIYKKLNVRNRVSLLNKLYE